MSRLSATKNHDAAEATANTTHRSSTGADHTWLDQDVTSGSSPVLAVTNMTGSAAGLDSDATAHAAADGSSHTFIDQDVTSGASPVLAVTNMTGSAAGLDSDATAHAAADGSSHTFIDQDVTSGASPVLAVTNMTGSAAGLDSDATAHAAADGSSHTFIDQDVTSGAAPVLAVTNMTGSAAGIDSDATTHAASTVNPHQTTFIVSGTQAVAATASFFIMIAPSAGRIIALKARAGAGAAAGESLVVDVHEGGVSMMTTPVTLDNAAGTNVQTGTVDAGAPGAMAVNNIITWELTYVAGGGPTPIVDSEYTAEFRLD
jgi:hypothetical protein